MLGTVGALLSTGIAASTVAPSVLKLSRYATSSSRSNLVVSIRSVSGIDAPLRLPVAIRAAAKALNSQLADPASGPVMEDVTGKCDGQVHCEECDGACRDYKFGMWIVKELDSINDDGDWDKTINHIEDYVTGELTDFGCTCSGI